MCSFGTLSDLKWHDSLLPAFPYANFGCGALDHFVRIERLVIENIDVVSEFLDVELGDSFSLGCEMVSR